MRLQILVLCGAALGCAGSGSKSAADASVVRPVQELPEDYRELWVSYLEERSDWPERRAAAIGDGEQEVFLVSNLIRTLLKTYGRGELSRVDDPVTSLYRRSADELVGLGEVSAPALAELLALGNGQGTGIASELLERIGVPALDPLLEQLVREDKVDARRRAAALLERMPYGLHGAEDRVRAALIQRVDEDPDWLVRDRSVQSLAARAQRDTTIEEASKALARALFDEDKEVRRNAAVGLVELRNPDSVPALINLLDRSSREADVGGLRLAQEALMALTGHEARLNADEWRVWWNKYRPR